MSIEKRLGELERLKEKGLITEEEYQSRRPAIIASADARRGGGGFFKWTAVGCLSIVGGFITLIIVIVVILALVAHSATSKLQDGHAAFAEGATAAAQTAGDVKVQVTIDKITDATSANQSEPPKPGYHYWAIAVTIENVGAPDASGGLPSLRATNGNEIVDYQPTFVSNLGANDLPLADGGYTLTPGGKKSGTLAFEVPDSWSVQWLKFDPNPLANGDIYFDAK